MACEKCGSTDLFSADDTLCISCWQDAKAIEDAKHLAELRGRVTEAKPYGVLGCQFGRAWDSWVDTFATLEAAAEHIKAQWQGEDFRDSDKGFHTDYSTYELIGFTLADIGL